MKERGMEITGLEGCNQRLCAYDCEVCGRDEVGTSRHFKDKMRYE
jgi:hypothetical protein